MSLDTFSAHRFCTGFTDGRGRLFLSDRVPFTYRALADNRVHPVRQGDTLRGLAAHYFAPLVYAAELWYFIADFQPAELGGPIHDPTIALDPNKRARLVIPSVATVLAEGLSEARRLEHDV